jgi:hypothetical protein
MLESRLVKGLAIWMGLWVLGFSVNALMLQLGIPLHGSYLSSLILGIRDLALLGLSLWLWRRWFPARWEEQSWRPSGLDYGMIMIALLVTALYYQRLFIIGEQSSASVVIMDQLQFRTPPRIGTLIAFQQIMTTFFLLDLCRERWGDRKGLLTAAAIFSLSHVLGVFINNPLSFAAQVTVGSFVGLMLWGSARIRWRSPWTPFMAHYLFYLGVLLGKAMNWS